MTKKEQLEMSELKERLAMALALSWPSYSKPQRVDTSTISYRGLVTGWFQRNGSDGHNVSLGCSDGVHHSPSNPEKTSTQRAGVFYTTKADALKVARIEMTERFARMLARVDADITKAEAEE
jgi:hypothetical protein